jgi:hypothetical protein
MLCRQDLNWSGDGDLLISRQMTMADGSGGAGRRELFNCRLNEKESSNRLETNMSKPKLASPPIFFEI